MFQVITDSVLTGSLAVRTATGIPNLYDTYTNGLGETDTRALARSINANQDDALPERWMVEVEYSSQHAEQEHAVENPLDEPPQVEWGFVTYQEPATKAYDPADDNDDEPTLAVDTSAEEPYDPPPMKDASRLTLNITRNEAAFDHNLASDYQDAVNKEEFLGFDPGKAKIVSLRARAGNRSGIKFSITTYEIHFRDEGWDLKLLDQGYQIIDANNKKVAYRDVNGSIPSAPILLDGAGGELAVGDPPQFRTFRIYRRKDFTPLNLEAVF